YHACARLDTGGVRCWGYGFVGQLGYASTANVGDNETPASMGDVPLGGKAVEIEAALKLERESHTCARLDTGALRCWGYGALGELGYVGTANIGDNETPASAGDVVVEP